MSEFRVRIRSFAEVRHSVTLAMVQLFPIAVGSSNRWVNGMCFIGMFSLDYCRPLTIRLSCTRAEYQNFCAAVSEFAAE